MMLSPGGLTPGNFYTCYNLNLFFILQLLIKHSVDCNVNSQTFDGTTPLIQAVKSAVEYMVGALLENGAEINAVDNNGR